ncbi:hypothetical protein [Heyndrickxia sporothermodurans]
MKVYLAVYENHSEEYEYSLHRTLVAAETAARAMLMVDMDIGPGAETDDGELIADLDLEALGDWLGDENGHSVGVRELTLED